MAKKLLKKKISKIKTKKKIWYKIIAPKLFSNKEVGETYLSNIEKAVGRSMKINLRNLTGSVQDQNAYIMFRIDHFKDSVLQTKTIGYELVPAFIKRLVRKNTVRIDDYFNFTTKSGQNIILKSLMVTKSRVQHSVRTELSKQLQLLLKEEIAKTDFDNFLSNVINQKIRRSFKKKLGKVYPLKDVTVRVLKLKE